VILAHQDEPASAILEAVEKAIDDFTGSSSLFDDITLLIVRRL
jgi:hypothetical protein